VPDAERPTVDNNEVAKVVAPDVAETDLLSEPSPAPDHHVWSPGSFTEWVNSEDESGLFEIPSGRCGGSCPCAPRSTSASTACVVSDTTRGLPVLVE
jgi:hypothetical protein